MSLRKIKFALVAAVASAGIAMFAPARADAGTLDLSAYGWFATFDDNVDLTILSTSNDGIVVSLQKFADFTGESTATGVPQPLSIIFRQTSRNAVSQIAIEEETVINDTGTSWSGFRFLVEGGVGGSHPDFDTAKSAGFSTDPFPVQTYLNNNKELRVSGGSLSSAVGSNIWTPGRETGALYINAKPFTSGTLNQTFVFKEQPILIPLPAAAWTSLSGLLAVGFFVGAKQARRILS